MVNFAFFAWCWLARIGMVCPFLIVLNKSVKWVCCCCLFCEGFWFVVWHKQLSGECSACGTSPCGRSLNCLISVLFCWLMVFQQACRLTLSV